MLGAISVLAGVGLVCASGVVVSSALKFFYTYEFDLAAKMNESKKGEIKMKAGDVEHAKHMENLSPARRTKF